MELPERNFGFLLHDVARLMRKRFEQNARGLGLTRSQCSVLAHLARHEGIQQSGLAEILEVEPITLTRILDRLEEKGLLRRERCREDRRVVFLRVAAAGRAQLPRLRATGTRVLEEHLAGFDAAEVESLKSYLGRMIENGKLSGGAHHDRAGKT